jgi:hypothetical protein
VANPLAFIGDLNGSPGSYYHSVKEDGEQGVFSNYRTRRKVTRALSGIEAEKLDTPVVEEGDILLINPKRFHKTNTTAPKHAIVIKFVLEGENGFLSREQVPAMFWPEVGMFNRMLKSASDWDGFLAALREKLHTPEGRKALSAGFFPEKTGLYKKMVAAI